MPISVWKRTSLESEAVRSARAGHRLGCVPAGSVESQGATALAAITGSVGLVQADAASKKRSAGNVCAANGDCASSRCISAGGARKVCACAQPGDCPPSTDQCHDAACPPSGLCGVTTEAGFTLCAGLCVDTTSDVANCGTCGITCPQPANSTATCAAGSCLAPCNSGYARCAGVCVDLDSDVANFGNCGVTCPPTKTCAVGSCVAA